MSRARSPAYPYVDLGKAIELATKIYASAKTHSLNVDTLVAKLGYKSMNGSAKKTLAALKYFGLLEQQHGSTEAKLTKRTLHILHGLEGSDERNQAIKDAFLEPAIYRYCWDTWKADDISVEVMKSHLILKKGFNDSTVVGFINNYRQSMRFAGMTTDDDLSEENVVVADEQMNEDGAEEQHRDQGNAREASQVDFSGVITRVPHPGEGMRQETFTLSNSDVVIQFPAVMTAEDFEDLCSWLDILKRKIGRQLRSLE